MKKKNRQPKECLQLYFEGEALQFWSKNFYGRYYGFRHDTNLLDIITDESGEISKSWEEDFLKFSKIFKETNFFPDSPEKDAALTFLLQNCSASKYFMPHGLYKAGKDCRKNQDCLLMCASFLRYLSIIHTNYDEFIGKKNLTREDFEIILPRIKYFVFWYVTMLAADWEIKATGRINYLITDYLREFHKSRTDKSTITRRDKQEKATSHVVQEYIRFFNEHKKSLKAFSENNMLKEIKKEIGPYLKKKNIYKKEISVSTIRGMLRKAHKAGHIKNYPWVKGS